MTRRPGYPHQQEATAKALQRGSMGFWAEQRTGKSKMATDTVDALGAYPCLIVCPYISLPSWIDEFRKEGWEKWEAIPVRPRGSKPVRTALNLFGNRGARVFICNIESLVKLDALNIRSPECPQTGTGIHIERMPRGLGLPDWKSIIIDESYRIAHSETKITEYLLGAPRPEGQHRFCLSGTPASEHGYDFASQYIFLEGHFFGCATVGAYMEKYWQFIENTYSWKVKDEKHITEIRDYVQDRGYCITMEDLGLGAEIFYGNRLLPPNKAQTDLLKWLSIATTYPHKKTGEIMPMEPVVRTMFERRTASGVHPLTDEIISDTKIRDAVEFYLSDPRPMFVVNRWRPLVKAVSDALNAAGVRCDFIQGGVPRRRREQIRIDFQEGRLDAVSGQVSAVQESLDLSRLETILFMSNDGAQYSRAQVEKRGNTTSRDTPYFIIDQQTEGTNDAKITHILTVKKRDCRYYIEDLNRTILQRTP